MGHLHWVRNFVGINSSYGRSLRFVLYVTLPNNTNDCVKFGKCWLLFWAGIVLILCVYFDDVEFKKQTD